jgi:hypothetical protein
MRKKSIRHIIIVLVLALLSIHTACASPAQFVVSNLSISPGEVIIGAPATVTVDLENTGGTEGTYTVILRVDGVETETRKVTLAAGAEGIATFTITLETAGTYQIEVSGLAGTLKVLKPAELKATSLEVMPESVQPSQKATIKAYVTNSGQVEGIYQAIFKVNGGVVETKEITVDSGETKTVSFDYSTEVAGTYHLQVGEVETTLEVLRPAIEVTQPVPPELRPTQVAKQPTPLTPVPPPTTGPPSPGVVATVAIYPPLLILSTSGANTGILTLEARDANGNVLELTGRRISFINSRPDVITVNNIGVVTAIKAQSSIFETPYISVSVDGVTSLNNTIVRVTEPNLPVSWDSYVSFQGQHVAYYMPKEAAGIVFGKVMQDFDVAGATDVAYLLEKELLGVTPFHGMVQIFIGEPGESDELSPCGISGNPVRLGYNVNKSPPHNNCIREPEGHPHWGVIWHEMGHNFTWASVRFGQLYQGSVLYSEAMATLAMMYAEYRIVNEPGHFGLGDITAASVGGNSYGAFGFNRRVFLLEGLKNYETAGANFQKMDANILDGIFFKLAETYSWDIFPRLFKIFLPADTPWGLFDQANTEVKKHTVTICALSIAAGVDLREQFKAWHFPIDDTFYEQIRLQLEPVIQD